jgi:hypothetical protein
MRGFGEVAEWLNAAVLKCLQLASISPRKVHLSATRMLIGAKSTLSCLIV